MPLLSDTKLGPYEIGCPLGAGGMGEVYRAHDSRLDRDVAIKVLPEYLTSDPDRLRRFEQEARATAALSHPNILAIFEMDTHGSVSYLVEELLEGETLRERLGRGPIALRKAIDYGVQIAHGLAAAHDKGIVHRDLKPENLFVTKDGRVKVLDFGLARLTQPKETSGFEATQELGTEPGMVMGTVGYMAPEQVKGKTADHRADIFAFGAILYEMVTGKQGFRKPTSAETMTAILNEEPPSISQLTPTAPPGMQRVVHRCLEKNPEQRFQSASDMAFALEALSDSNLTSGTGAHAVQEGGSNRLRIALAAGAALLAVLAIAALVYYVVQPSAPPKLSNVVQLTNDGQPKFIVGTEGSRLYLSYVGRDSAGLVELPATGGEPNKLPFAGNSNLSPLALSPDGSQFLMVDGHGFPVSGPLWSLPVLGGSPRPLADLEGDSGAWSPDGKLLAYAVGNNLFVAGADGRDPRKVVTMKDPADVWGPVWSPDGSRLRFTIYVAGMGQTGQFWEVSVDGTGLRRLHPERPDLRNECCGTWTADGKYFLFLSNNQIWGLARNSGFLRAEPKPIQLTSSPMPLSRPVPSTDGKKVFVVGRTLRGELVRYNSQSGRFDPFLGGISAEFVDFSRDGQWVAYVTFPDGVLWRSKVDGSERLQLTYPPSHPFSPHWSPDSQTIAFYDASPGKQIKIYTVSSQGGSPRPLLPDDPSPQYDPTSSPDGSKIVFGGALGDSLGSIRILDLATHHQITTLPGSQGLFSPRWSPDGRYVSALNYDQTKLLIFDFHTQKWMEVAKGSLAWPSFTRDGQYLDFLDYSGTGSIMRVRLSNLHVERVADLKNTVMGGQYGSWFAPTPDGSFMLLRDTGTTDVYSLDWEEP
jgi:serine/threonine protein kinase/Tol biopolymer transport system component